MNRIKLSVAVGLVLTAGCASDDASDTTASASSPSTAIAPGESAIAMLSPELAAAFAELVTQSATPPDLAVDAISTAVTGIGLDLPPLAATPVDSARLFIKRWQTLLDDRVASTEYQLVA